MGALLDIVNKDEGLKKDKEILALFRSYATLFDGELRENLMLTSLDLDDKYNTNDSVGWRKFVNYAPIRKFIEDLLLERADKNAKLSMTVIGGQDVKDALHVQKMVEERRKGEDNSHIVVMFLPKRDFGLDD
jgi:hypothetical protein